MHIQAVSISESVSDYLRACGFGDDVVKTATPETRIFHDLGQTGDDFLETIDVLATKFGVNLSGMDVNRYTPGELELDSLLLRFRKTARLISPTYVGRRLSRYEPVTLRMIEHVLKTKRWDFS